VVAWWRGGVVAWWRGGVVAWWRGGVVAWWRGGVVAWWRGGVVEWWKGGWDEFPSPCFYLLPHSPRYSLGGQAWWRAQQREGGLPEAGSPDRHPACVWKMRQEGAPQGPGTAPRLWPSWSPGIPTHTNTRLRAQQARQYKQHSTNPT